MTARSVAFFLTFLVASSSGFAGESWRSKIFGFELYTVPAHNMEPTLHYEEVAQADTGAYSQGLPLRKDVIAYQAGPNENMIHLMRVVALGGDVVEIRDGVLLVNGEKVEEPYIAPQNAQKDYSRNFKKAIVPPGHVFVLGDLRDNSSDSRINGPIAVSKIKGKIVLAKKSVFSFESREVH